MTPDAREPKELLETCRAIPGWMADCELEWIYARAREVPVGGVWVELGTLKGRSLVAAGLGLQDGCELWGVDNYLWQPGDCVECLQNIRWLQTARPGLKVGLIVADAVVASQRFAAASVEAIFIDADHSYEEVKSQIAAWAPKTTNSGRLCGHDYDNPEWPGVTLAVTESLRDVQIGPFSIWDCRMPIHAAGPPLGL